MAARALLILALLGLVPVAPALAAPPPEGAHVSPPRQFADSQPPPSGDASSPNAAPENTLSLPRLVAPVDGATIRANGNPVKVDFVWAASAEPLPVTFFIEIVALEKGNLREVFAGYMDHSPATVPLNANSTHYAWRLYVVRKDAPEYASTAWSRFSISPPK